MSEREQEVVDKLIQAIPKMNDFQKGYTLGMVEGANIGKHEPDKNLERR